MCGHAHWKSLSYGHLKARGVKKESVPDMIMAELTYVPISGIVYSDVNRFFIVLRHLYSYGISGTKKG